MEKTCTLLFLRRDDEVLLAMKKRGFGSDRWNGIGGKIDPGETEEQALIRECQEEIEVTPTVFEKVAYHDFVMDNDSDQPWHMHVHTYIATVWDGEPAETEEMAPQWFKLADIPYDQMWQDDIYWLPAVLAGQSLKTRFVFDTNEQMLSAELTPVSAAIAE